MPRPCLDRSSASPTCRRFCALAAKANAAVAIYAFYTMTARPVVIPEGASAIKIDMEKYADRFQ